MGIIFGGVLLVGVGAASLAPNPSTPVWSGSARTATFVAMPDGTKLAVDWVVPTGWQGQGPAPTKPVGSTGARGKRLRRR